MEEGVLLIHSEGDSPEEIMGLYALAKILPVDVCLQFLVAGDS